MKTLKEITDAVHQLAWKKGRHEDSEEEDAFIERACNLLHDEVSELHDAWRNNRLHQPCDKTSKMLALGLNYLTYAEKELADIIISALDCSKKLDIDIQLAIETKHAFNKTRSYKHGGKRS